MRPKIRIDRVIQQRPELISLLLILFRFMLIVKFVTHYLAIQRVAPPTNRAPKMASKFVGTYMMKAVLENDQFVVTDVPVYPRNQKPIFPAQHLKIWGKEDSSSDENRSNI